MSLTEKMSGRHPLSDAEAAYLSPLYRRDISSNYVDGINDPEVRAFLGHDRNLTVEEIQDFVVAHENSEHQILLGFFLNGVHRGNIRLHDCSEASIWLGIALFDKAVWNKGWATKLLKSALKLVWARLSVKTVYAGVDSLNVASSKAFHKAGFFIDKQTASGFVFASHRPSIGCVQ
ncbi:MAG: GNAT family N-acetyltransferase [Thalassospira sp.]|uniref:GNAT family N-acetyltransferase n=1 Tax=Thalassospira sp. TaxID=1912094 RepID=UPI0032EDBF6D